MESSEKPIKYHGITPTDPGVRSIWIAKLQEAQKNLQQYTEIVQQLALWAKNEDPLTGEDTFKGDINHLSKLKREVKKWDNLLRPPSYSSKLSTANFQSKIAQAKETPIQELLPSQQKTPYQTSQRIKALCPFHTEKSPSFTIYLNNNTFHCFGCQANGDSIDFVQRLHSLSFKEAINLLIK